MVSTTLSIGLKEEEYPVHQLEHVEQRSASNNSITIPPFIMARLGSSHQLSQEDEQLQEDRDATSSILME